ncbi:hypothetical protein GE09DRAFT_581660 [Coniochaeta sp. 2T2.1]|nr:hypothetical protein GE09DRAFT_581660 [Coniochaeta sp. 2T2.1]
MHLRVPLCKGWWDVLTNLVWHRMTVVSIVYDQFLLRGKQAHASSMLFRRPDTSSSCFSATSCKSLHVDGGLCLDQHNSAVGNWSKALWLRPGSPLTAHRLFKRKPARSITVTFLSQAEPQHSIITFTRPSEVLSAESSHWSVAVSSKTVFHISDSVRNIFATWNNIFREGHKPSAEAGSLPYRKYSKGPVGGYDYTSEFMTNVIDYGWLREIRGLLLTSRRVREEVLDILYGENIFRIDLGPRFNAEDFKQKLSEGKSSRIRSLMLVHDAYDFDECRMPTFIWQDIMSNITTLYTVFDQPCPHGSLLSRLRL